MPSNMLDLKYDVYSAPPYNFDFFNITPNDVETNLNYQYVSPFDTNVYGLPYSWGNFKLLESLDQSYTPYQGSDYNFELLELTAPDVSTTLDTSFDNSQAYKQSYSWGAFRWYETQSSPSYLSTLHTNYDSPVNVPAGGEQVNRLGNTSFVVIVSILIGVLLITLLLKGVK